MTQAEHQRRYRERLARELAQLREAVEQTKAADSSQVEQLRAELAQQREIVRSTLGELARVEDERDQLRLELARLSRASPAEPKASRRKRP